MHLGLCTVQALWRGHEQPLLRPSSPFLLQCLVSSPPKGQSLVFSLEMKISSPNGVCRLRPFGLPLLAWKPCSSKNFQVTGIAWVHAKAETHSGCLIQGQEVQGGSDLELAMVGCLGCVEGSHTTVQLPGALPLQADLSIFGPPMLFPFPDIHLICTCVHLTV